MRISLSILAGLFFSLILQGVTPTTALLSRQPLRFEKNQGQPGARLQYLARGRGFELAVDSTQNELRFAASGRPAVTFRTRFAGARSAAKIDELDPLDARTSYFLGNRPDEWRAGVANFGKLQVTQIYRGVDLAFYGSAGTLEYDFVVHPGADPSVIRFEIDGARSLRVDRDGDLVLSAQSAEVRWKRPFLYQELGGEKKQIEGRFALHGRSVGFEIGGYDRKHALIIDPVLNYATYLGGAGDEGAKTIGVDGAGNIYIAGATTSSNLAVTKGVFQPAYGGGTNVEPGDAFVAKLNPGGQLLYMTYLGGTGDEGASSIAVDSAGDVYITGATTSVNFPTTTGVLQPKFGGSGGNACYTFGDAFVAKLNPAGSQLLYSTYLGGSLDDGGTAIAVDAAGNAYVAGATLSHNFPSTPGAYQPKFAGSGGEPGKPFCNGAPSFSAGDAFITKINPAGSSLVFSTYLGGTEDDLATTIALDSAQNIYVGGYTLSSNFPATAGAFQTASKGTDFQNEFFHTGDGFVAKLNSAGSALVYSTYLGGMGDDIVANLVVDSAGTAYITGSTSSPDFPVTSGAVQHTYGGYYTLPFLVEQLVGDAFVTRLNAAGTALLYSTYYGGSQNDSGMSVNVDSSGLIYLVGATDSLNLPTTSNATQRAFGGDSGQFNYYEVGDGFLAVIDPNSKTPVFSTYYGGSLDDGFGAAVLDGKGSIWITGNTISANFPVTPNAMQARFGGRGTVNGTALGGDAVVVQYYRLRLRSERGQRGELRQSTRSAGNLGHDFRNLSGYKHCQRDHFTSSRFFGRHFGDNEWHSSAAEFCGFHADQYPGTVGNGARPGDRHRDVRRYTLGSFSVHHRGDKPWNLHLWGQSRRGPESGL